MGVCIFGIQQNEAPDTFHGLINQLNMKFFDRLKQRFSRNNPGLFHTAFEAEWNRIQATPRSARSIGDHILDTAAEQGGKATAESWYRQAEVQKRAAPLKIGESAAATLTYPKISAILYDRIWAGITLWEPEAPLEVLFPTESDCCIQFLFDEGGATLPTPEKVRNRIRGNPEHYEKTLPANVRDLEKKFKRRITTVFAAESVYDATYRPGRTDVLVAALSNVPFINEQQLVWEQVLEVRRDKIARGSVKAFFKWADTAFIGKGEGEIVDLIGERLADYEEALKKHGIDKVIASLETILDFKTLASGPTVAYLIEYDKWIAAVSGMSLAVANITLNLAKKQLELAGSLAKIQKDHADVAFLATTRSKSRVGAS